MTTAHRANVAMQKAAVFNVSRVAISQCLRIVIYDGRLAAASPIRNEPAGLRFLG